MSINWERMFAGTAHEQRYAGEFQSQNVGNWNPLLRPEPAPAPPPAAPGPFDFLRPVGDAIGGAISGINNLQRNTSAALSQNPIVQGADWLQQTLQAPGDWVARNVFHTPDVGTPGSPEYQATQLLRHTATPTDEQVQAQSSQMNNFLYSSLGGGLRNVTGGSLGRAAEAPIGSISQRTALPAPVRPELPSGHTTFSEPYRSDPFEPAPPPSRVADRTLALPSGAIQAPGAIAERAPGQQFWGAQDLARPAVVDTTARPITAAALRPRLTSADIQTIPPGPNGPAPFEVRYGAAQDALRAGRDQRAAVAAADARWQGLRSDVRAAMPQDQARSLANESTPMSTHGQGGRPFAEDQARSLTSQRTPMATTGQGGRPFAEDQAEQMAKAPDAMTTKPATPIGGLTARGITTTPIGREDLGLKGARFALPGAGEVAPIGLNDLRARIGAPAGEGSVPLDAEQLSARIGAKTRPQAENSLNNSMQVEARQAATQGTIASSGMSGPLVGRAFGKGGSQLERAGRTGITAADLSASLERQAKVHNANEAAVAAAKAQDFTAYERALRDIKSLGGDLSHTKTRLRQAGVFSELKTAPAPNSQINDVLAKNSTVQATPIEIARALEQEATRIMKEDTAKLPKRGLIGSRSLQPNMGGFHSDVVQSEAQRTYGSGLARGTNSYSPTADRTALAGRASDLTATARGIREQLNVIKDAKAQILAEQKASRGAQPWGLSEEDRLMAAKSPSYRADMGLHEPDPAVIAAAEARIKDAQAQLREHLADAEAHGVKTPAQAAVAKLADAVRATLGGKNETPTNAPNVPSGGPGSGLRNFTKEEGGSARLDLGLGNFGGNRPIRMADFARKAEQVSGVTKTLGTALSPAHFMFRHALPAMAAHPQAWLKGSAKGLKEGITMNPEQLAKRIDSMRSNLISNGYGDVYIGRPHLGIVGGEEAVATNIASKNPALRAILLPITRSGQGFTMGLNEVRYELTKGINDFAVVGAKKGLLEPMTMADRAEMADTINTYTGRGVNSARLGDTGKAAMRALNVPMFSPQLSAARVKMLGYTAKGIADVLHNVVQRKPVDPVALERARLGIGAMIGMGGLYALTQAAGGKVDTNPTSTTAGQVDMGPPSAQNGIASFLATETGIGAGAFPGQNVFLNPTESEAGLIRTMARMAVTLHDTLTGSKDAKWSTLPTNTLDVATKYLYSQLFSSPIAYPLAQFLQGFAVNPLGPITPMPVNAALTGAGIQPPEVGGKPAKTPAPAKTIRPVATPRATR